MYLNRRVFFMNIKLQTGVKNEYGRTVLDKLFS